MNQERPDLSQVSLAVRAYIQALEAEIEQLRARKPGRSAAPPPEPPEPPTTVNLITVTRSGQAKRTPRHLYPRQRRGGMGVFDIETGEQDPPALLALADESATLLLLTESARAFTLPVGGISQAPVRGRGAPLRDLAPLPDGERIVYAGPVKLSGSLALASERGYVRVLRHNFLAGLRPGTSLMDTGRFGSLAAAGWMDADQEVFIATQQGLAIRFRARLVHPNGSLGIRLARQDVPVAVTGVDQGSSVFLLGHDGKGTLRRMSGFRSNKAPGAGGKIALKTDKLAAALQAGPQDELFVLSQLSKIIRFRAAQIPPKEGAVQGVNCMSLRADACVAAAVSRVE